MSPWSVPAPLAVRRPPGARQETAARAPVHEGQGVEVGLEAARADPVAAQAEDLGDLAEVEGEVVAGRDALAGGTPVERILTPPVQGARARPQEEGGVTLGDDELEASELHKGI